MLPKKQGSETNLKFFVYICRLAVENVRVVLLCLYFFDGINKEGRKGIFKKKTIIPTILTILQFLEINKRT